MVVIIDYGMGNAKSVLNMVSYLGYPAVISRSHEEIRRASHLILPGVGAFSKGIDALRRYDLVCPLEDRVLVKKTPILGICLGMQLFAVFSEEGVGRGLGWIDAKFIKFSQSSGLKVPNMGWRYVSISKDDEIFKGVDEKQKFYFVHSYYMAYHSEYTVASSNYGREFSAIIRQENIYGMQFHPEKSHSYGMAVLKNFLELSDV